MKRLQQQVADTGAAAASPPLAFRLPAASPLQAHLLRHRLRRKTPMPPARPTLSRGARRAHATPGTNGAGIIGVGPV
eukprot:12406251-Alexandrium_andersonii.AAC.1